MLGALRTEPSFLKKADLALRIAVALFGLTVAPASAQPSSISDQANVNRVPPLPPPAPQYPRMNETSVAVNPLNPLVLVAAWNFQPSVTDTQTPPSNGFAASTDGGAHWTEYSVPNVPGLGDPMTGADPRTGTLWVGAASNASFFVAKWNGAGFEPASTFAWVESTDKPFMAAGPRPGQPNTTRLYVSFWATSGRYLTWSDDFGATWPGNLPLPSPPAGLSISTLPRVGPNGELYIFTDDGRFGIYLIRSLSENAGTPNLEQPIRIATRLDTWDPGRPEFNVRIPGYFNAAPYTHGAVDPVSDGTLYCVYHDTTRALCSCCPEVCTAWDIDIYFVMSTDFGATWTPVPQRILGADHVPYDQFFPWIEAVRSPVERSATRLDLVFFDTRGAVHTDADYPALLRTQYAWSNDRGATWQETTVAPRFAGAPAVWRATDTWYGEYIGMASAPTLAVPVYPTGGPGPAFNPPDWPPEEHIWANPIIWP